MHAVGVIIENNKGEILVLKRSEKSSEGGRYGLVGGKIDSGESKEQAIIREAKEEIGVNINPLDLKFIQTYFWNKPDSNIIFDVFKLPASENHKNFTLSKNEISDYLWESPENLLKRNDLMLGLYDILKTQYDLS